jgi:hypothetical protein
MWRVSQSNLLRAIQGKKFGAEIAQFGKDVANDFVSAFSDGEVSALLKEGTQAFGDSTAAALSSWNDGKITLGDFTAAIDLIGQGLKLAFDFLVAGITDLVNAIGSFFKNVGEAIGCFFGFGEW